MFLGREKEINELNYLYQRNEFQLFILYGRRRVGKTTLLQEFCKNKPSIFYSAEQSNEKLNLEKFSALVFQHYDEQLLEPFSTWEKAIRYIHERQQAEALVLVFDEFPYLANINSSLMSMLQHLIDHTLKNGKLFLVLCGSYMGFMEKEVLGSKSPLFGRRTAQMHMKPFDYRASSEFLDGFSVLDKLLFYGAYGGTAMYLQQIDRRLSFKNNIKNTFLKPTGYLYEEPLLLMRQEVQEPGTYYAIIEAIANGAARASEIAAKTGEDTSKCLKYIETLRELGIVYKERPLGEKESSRKSQYGICDPMFRFWFRYVSTNRTLLETNAADIVWQKRIEPDLNHYMGHIFEKICRDYLLWKNTQGELPFLFTDIGRWWGTNNKKRVEIEIDLVAKDGKYHLFGECKWRNEALDYSVLTALRDKADVFSQQHDKTWFVLFSKSGFTDAVREAAMISDDIILVTPDDMLV